MCAVNPFLLLTEVTFYTVCVYNIPYLELECKNQQKDKDEPYKWFQDSLGPGIWEREKSNKKSQSESEKQIEYK